MAEYFMEGQRCSECEHDDCNITTMFIDNDFNIPKMVKFDQFVRDEYSYTNKHGIKKLLFTKRSC